MSLSARKLRPTSAAAAPIRVVARASLSPRHTLYLVETAGRVLVVGTGPQGAPNLIGSWAAEASEPSADRAEDARASNRLVGDAA
jgi:hypothetical protein